MKVGIVGGGITGLAAAFYLSRAGVQSEIIEAAPDLGGLVRSYDFGPFEWDKYYHATLTSDLELLDLLEDLDLTKELRWAETKTGFYSKYGLHSMSNTVEFLRFPVLNLWEKFRLGLGILYSARMKDLSALEHTKVREWLVRVFGQGNYDKVWGPLLKCKLGSARDEASAAFIWSYITRYYSTRQKGASKKEVLGYVRGSYKTVIARLIERLTGAGVSFLLGAKVQEIRSFDGRVDVVTEQGVRSYDRVIFTGPSENFARVTPGLAADYRARLRSVKYLGVICCALVLKRSLSSFYVTNLIDPGLPFTGVIEMTAMVSREETAGRHLVYVPKYVVPGDAAFDEPDEKIWAEVRAGLGRMYPDLQDSDIERKFFFRERFVQPIPVLSYSELIPPMQTDLPGVFLANTTFIINRTLSNNEMVKIAKRAVGEVLASVQEAAAPSNDVANELLAVSKS